MDCQLVRPTGPHRGGMKSQVPCSSSSLMRVILSGCDQSYHWDPYHPVCLRSPRHRPSKSHTPGFELVSTHEADLTKPVGTGVEPQAESQVLRVSPPHPTCFSSKKIKKLKFIWIYLKISTSFLIFFKGLFLTEKTIFFKWITIVFIEIWCLGKWLFQKENHIILSINSKFDNNFTQGSCPLLWKPLNDIKKNSEKWYLTLSREVANFLYEAFRNFLILRLQSFFWKTPKI